MSPILTDQPLTDEQFDRLGTFLEAHGSAGVNLEWVDGYFAALICGPDMVPPSEYLSQVLGEEFDFDSGEQASDIIELLMLHWNTIAGELLRTLGEPNVYMPVLLQDDAGIARGNNWAKGFMRGVQMQPESWRELLHSDKHGGSALPMMMLAHEDDRRSCHASAADRRRETRGYSSRNDCRPDPDLPPLRAATTLPQTRVADRTGAP